jgi:hypothetical protein
VVRSLTVTFDMAVTFAGGNVTGAFTLTRNGGGAVGFTATATLDAFNRTVVTLNAFTGAETAFGSLNDGRYTLTALASAISANGIALDGAGTGTPGSNYVLTDTGGLFRFYGDINGDQIVNGLDFGSFRSAFGTATGDANFNAAFDYNNDGVINGLDFAQFRIRFGTTLP